MEKTLTKAAIEAAGIKVPPAPAPGPAPAPAAPPPRKPWEKNRTKFGPTHLTVLSAVTEKVQGEADEWRAVLRDALKHVVTIVDFVPFNAQFATREEQGRVKESIVEFIEMLGAHQPPRIFPLVHHLPSVPRHLSVQLTVAAAHDLYREPTTDNRHAQLLVWQIF